MLTCVHNIHNNHSSIVSIVSTIVLDLDLDLDSLDSLDTFDTTPSAAMPKVDTLKTTRSGSSLAKPSRSRPRLLSSSPPPSSTVPHPPPSSPESPPRKTVPAWVRRDWSQTSFGTPDLFGEDRLADQAEWAAKNASVAVHDVYKYNEGDWSAVKDATRCVYLAVCDAVLQR